MGDDHTRSRSRSRERTSRRHDERELDKERERDKGRRSRSRSPRRHDRSRSPRHRRSRSRERERSSKKHRKRSVSASSASSSDSESGRHKHKRKKRSKSEERYRKEKKQRKREKKERKRKAGTSSSSMQYGKYGIITDTDIYNKSSEFHTWLVEERKINPETVTKDQNRKEFARFVEDFNTATLPHEKYYNMEHYERRMNAMRAGEFLPPVDDSYDPQADMKALTTSQKRKPVEQESYLSKEQLMQLRKVQNERIEAGKMKLLGMEVKQSMGVRMEFED